VSIPEFEYDQMIGGCGFFRVRHPLFPVSRCAEVIERAQELFALPAGQKQLLAIEQSPHFRGYSVMESCHDWREQIHFGREESARAGLPVHHQLRGPNLWPVDPEWRGFVLRLMDDLETVGREVLSSLAKSLGFPESRFLRESETPYLLLKMIHYRGTPEGLPRSGVAPHVDFSWITLLLQDETGGLEVLNGEGSWMPAPPVRGTLLVNAGEILEFASNGAFPATPHRVVTGSGSRVSLPFFLNPGLDTRIEPIAAPQPPAASCPGASGPPGVTTHVHRVFCTPRTLPFVFGDEEWRRKGLGKYCELCRPG